MINSMTGYAHHKAVVANMSIEIEIKAVNNRYLDVSVKAPRQFGFLEDRVRSHIKGCISRGKIDVLVAISMADDGAQVVRLRRDIAKSYIDALNSLASEFEIKNDLTLSVVARQSDIFETDRRDVDADEAWAAVLVVLNEAIAAFFKMRKREGDRLSSDLVERCGVIGGLVREIEQLAPQTVDDHNKRLTARITELLAGANIDEGRLLTEVALFAEKVSITEELVRLKSHLSEMHDMLGSAEPVGRKMDFLLQELNREVNTIGSKANDISISRLVVAAKAELEKIREQVQNVE